jgi:hypothetical protein
MALTQEFGPQVGYTRLHISKNNVDLVRTHLWLPYECNIRSTSWSVRRPAKKLRTLLWKFQPPGKSAPGLVMAWTENHDSFLGVSCDGRKESGFGFGFEILSSKYSNMWMYIHYHIEFWIFPTLRFSGCFQIWNRHHSSMAWQPDITSSSLS